MMIVISKSLFLVNYGMSNKYTQIKSRNRKIIIAFEDDIQ